MPAYDFGYTWPWTYGHLIVSGVLALLCAAAWRFGSKWISISLGLLSAWALAGWLIVQFVFGFNSTMEMPTEAFFQSGQGKILDIGCGSGRTTVMVGLARPQARIVSLDNFSADYIKGNGPDLVMSNARIAGISDRVQVLKSDMRQIQAGDAEFDAAVSTYAIDHLGRADVARTLKEVNRVLKPGGEFLLAVITPDIYMKVTYGPFPTHAGFGGPGRWIQFLDSAGFQIAEQGRTPGSLYFVARKRPNS